MRLQAWLLGNGTKLSPHIQPGHGVDRLLPYVQAWQPISVKYLADDWPDKIDPGPLAQLYHASPNSILVLRSWALSEDKDNVKQNPEAVGQVHARFWANFVKRVGKEIGFPLQQVVFENLNEPDVYSPDAIRVFNAYTVAYIETMLEAGLIPAVGHFATGWPATNQHNEVDWTVFSPVMGLIETHNKKGTTVLFDLHEYHDDRGIVSDDWQWNPGRFLHLPHNIPIYIGEAGYDSLVNRKEGTEQHGWHEVMSTDVYFGHRREYDRRVKLDPRVLWVNEFTLDHNPPWGTFDILPIVHLYENHAGRTRRDRWASVLKDETLVSGLERAQPMPGEIPYQETFKQAADNANIPWRLIAAIAKVSSNYNPYAEGPGGEKGLMQFSPSAWATAMRSLGEMAEHYRASEPELSIRAAASYLSMLKADMTNSGMGEWHWVVAAFHAGKGRVMATSQIWQRLPEETKGWAARVLGLSIADYG